MADIFEQHDFLYSIPQRHFRSAAGTQVITAETVVPGIGPVVCLVDFEGAIVRAAIKGSAEQGSEWHAGRYPWERA